MKKPFLSVGLIAIAAGAAVAVLLLSPRKKPPPAAVVMQPAERAGTRFEDFVGAETCARCHAQQYDLWRRSTHGRAGGKPSQMEMIARFDGQPLQFKDAVVTPSTNAQGDYVFSVQMEGAPRFDIRVDAIVGGAHMHGGGTQSFFNEFPDGTLRFLPFDFGRRENLWFTQVRSDKTWVPITRELSLKTDLLNWLPNRVLGTSVEFSNCQNCHGSQITLTYDPAQRKHRTQFQTLQINCESCHGPGRQHVELASKPGFDKLADIGMEPLAAQSKDGSLMVCFQCHATKDAIRDAAYLPGEPLEDYFSIKLSLFAENPYLVDGRIRSFGYQANHLYSDCYLNGSMTCVDCHDPHSMEYRDAFQRPLTGKFDNRQCTGCHASKAVAPELHSHHLPGSPGNQCTSCHMPFLQHQGVGLHIAFARSDHTIPIPRPEFDHSLGIENACQKCHRDKDLAWQQGKVREWYGEIKPHHALIARLIDADKKPAGARNRLLAPDAAHPMAQMDALAAFVRTSVKPNTKSEIADKLRVFSRSPDIDLQALALMALHVSGEIEAADVTATQALKSRWGILADQFASMFSANGDLTNAIICLEKSLEVMPDNIVSLSHLAIARAKQGDLQSTLKLLKTAVAIRPHTANLHFQLAQTYLQMQEPTAAIHALEQGLSYAPDNQPARALLRQLRAASPNR
jgi:hypothetical protein